MFLDYTLDADELTCSLDADELTCSLDSYDESYPIYKLLLDFMRLSGDYINE
jgi:hypothetical protein